MLTWAPGDHSTKIISVVTLDDGRYSGPLTFHVTLSSPSQAAIAGGPGATVKVSNLDSTPTLTIQDASVFEGNSGFTQMVFTVDQSAANDVATKVHYATSPGTATAGSDYVSVSGWLVIPSGQGSGTLTVYVKVDTKVEPDETFFVTLTSPVNATLGTHSVATGTIENDD